MDALLRRPTPFELISASGSTRILHVEGTTKPHLVAALDLCEDEEPELLLCYNSVYLTDQLATLKL